MAREPIKIAANMSAVAHHIIDGPVTFPYAIDAHSAVSRFPDEWSHDPWSREDEARAREAAGHEVEPLTPEEQAAIDEHAKAVAEANERLKAFHEKQAEKKAEADQVAADEALVKSPAPRPDPAVRRPFGRKGEPTAAELEAQRKRDEKKAAGEKAAAEKAEQDRQANTNATMTG
jgi:tRNA(Ile)-lysidine synthase TilS/MesJ